MNSATQPATPAPGAELYAAACAALAAGAETIATGHTPRARRAETPEQKRARAERDRARKVEQREATRTPEQREALALAGELTSLIKRFPSLAPEINELVYTLNQRAAETTDRAYDSIKQLLGHGPATLEDMIDELKFSEGMIASTLEGMRTTGEAEEVERRAGGAARGFAQKIWRLTGKPPRSAMVRP